MCINQPKLINNYSLMFDLIFAYESDQLDYDQIIELFQQIYDTKAYLWLHGHYGRTLDHLIDSDLIITN